VLGAAALLAFGASFLFRQWFPPRQGAAEFALGAAPVDLDPAPDGALGHLEGTWHRASCLLDDKSSTLTIEGGRLTREEVAFSRAGCQGERYRLKARQALHSLTTARDGQLVVRSTLVSAEVIPTDAASLNAQAFLGHEDWQRGVARGVPPEAAAHLLGFASGEEIVEHFRPQGEELLASTQSQESSGLPGRSAPSAALAPTGPALEQARYVRLN
jgi:hypothetical protein